MEQLTLALSEGGVGDLAVTGSGLSVFPPDGAPLEPSRQGVHAAPAERRAPLPVRPSESASTQRKHRADDPSTSRRAALSAAPRAGSQRERILDAIVTTGERGLNYDEVSAATGIVAVSASTRITELARAGWIEASGERETSAGGKAVVWIATAKARGSVAA